MKMIAFHGDDDPSRVLSESEKAQLWDRLVARALVVELPHPSGRWRIIVERRESRAGIGEPLVRVLESVART